MIFIIDLNYLPFHTEEELKSLTLQIIQAYSILNKRGYKLVLSINQNVKYLDYLIRRIENTKIFLIRGSLKYSLSVFGITRPLVLDPYALRTLKEEDLYYFNGIIIGGIVDKTPKKGITTYLTRMSLPNVQSRKIELRGSRLGVPNTINGIVSLIVKTRELNNLEKAIKEVQSKREARVRAASEINKLKNFDCNKIFKKLEELKEWLNIDYNDFYKILSRTKYRPCIKLLKEIG
ncbi:MAG: hypothetical protein QXV69_03935 [Sulfolobaceae archaeon]